MLLKASDSRTLEDSSSIFLRVVTSLKRTLSTSLLGVQVNEAKAAFPNFQGDKFSSLLGEASLLSLLLRRFSIFTIIFIINASNEQILLKSRKLVSKKIYPIFLKTFPFIPKDSLFIFIQIKGIYNKRSFMIYLAILTAVCGLVTTYYDPPVALQMAYLAAISYESPETINAWSCKYCHLYQVKGPKAFYNSLSGLRGFTGYFQPLSSIIVSFKGADDINFFIQNLSNTKVNYDYCQGCEVSRNFYELYLTVQTTVLKQIQSLHSIYRGANIILTGHGFGGSLAILTSAQVARLYGSIFAVYTYGACRVGNQKFADYYDKLVPSTYRVINYADIVPHIPVPAAGYLHSGQEKWYSQGMKTFTSCQGDSANCSNSLPSSTLNTQDNDISSYLKLNIGENP